jgi:hypothetical protein
MHQYFRKSSPSRRCDNSKLPRPQAIIVSPLTQLIVLQMISMPTGVTRIPSVLTWLILLPGSATIVASCSFKYS